jgi:transcriptional regulator with XRE-family HTH domain
MEHQTIVLASEPLLESANKEVKNEVEETLHLRIRSLRKSQGKTMKEMSEFLNVSVSTYAGYEATTGKHKRIPALDKILNLANFYSVSVDFMLGKTDVMHPVDSIDIKELLDRSDQISAGQKLTVEEVLSILTNQKNQVG